MPKSCAPLLTKSSFRGAFRRGQIRQRALPVRKAGGLPGGIPEWSNGPDCKSGGSAFAGSNPASPIYLEEIRLRA